MKEEIDVLLDKSAAFRKKRDAGGLKYADEAYNLATRKGDKALILRALREKLSYALHISANLPEAENLAKELLAIPESSSQPLLTSFAYNTLGICNDVKGNYYESRDYYLKVIDLLKDGPNLTDEGKNTLGNAYYNIAKLYVFIEFTEDRFEYLDKAEKLFQETQYADGIGRVWNMRAAALPPETPVTERLPLFEKAIIAFSKGEPTIAGTQSKSNVGLCYCHLGQFDKGIKLLKEALAEIEIYKNRPNIAYTQYQLAEGYRRKGDHKAALGYLEQAEKLLDAAGARVYLNAVYREQAINLAAIGKYAEAYDRQEKFIKQVDERMKFDRETAVEEARLKFELEKSSQEAELLKLKNSEIESYNERLQDSVAELNHFAYVASHDLKEPLRMVSSYLILLDESLQGKLEGEQLLFMRYAREGTQRMLTLIDSLLAFARATAEAELQTVDLNLVLREVILIVQSDKQKQIDITNDKLPVLMAYHNQMIQLFQNLLTNAIKYNDKPGVRIHISYRSDGKLHTFTVADNGIGIQPQNRLKVFDIFKRLHNRDTYSGTGIGLAICKKIVNRLNGKIWIEDSDLGGAAFVFTLPVV